MSYLSRTLKKQRRIIESLKRTEIMVVSGFGLDQIVVFPERFINSNQAAELTKAIQQSIDIGEHQDIREFDSYSSPDIEFSAQYRGCKRSKFQGATKKNLLELGKFWRQRVLSKFPDSNLTIVVHYQSVDDSWFLDVFNYSIQSTWDTPEVSTYWL